VIRKRKKHLMFVNVVAMGDIAFLLIIFFILIGNFMKENMKFKPPVSQDLSSLETPLVTVVMDENGAVWLQGVQKDVRDLASDLQRAVGSHEDRPVHVKIHRTIPRKDFLPVIEALSEAGVRIVLAGERGDSN